VISSQPHAPADLLTRKESVACVRHPVAPERVQTWRNRKQFVPVTEVESQFCSSRGPIYADLSRLSL
jgi:hypothetical protein